MSNSAVKLIFLPFLLSFWVVKAESYITDVINDELTVKISGIKPVAAESLQYISDSELEICYKNSTKIIWNLKDNSKQDAVSSAVSPVKKSYPKASSSDGKYTAEAPGDGFIRIFDSYGEIFQVIEIFSGKVTSLSFVNGSKFLFAGTSEAIISVYDVRTGALKNILSGHSGYITSISSTQNGKTATSDSKGFVRLRNESDFAIQRTLVLGNNGFWVLWNDDGTLSGSKNLEVGRSEGLVQASFKSPQDNIPKEAVSSAFALGAFYLQENPFSPENKYVSNRMGAGLQGEYQTSFHFGVLLSASFNIGVINGDTVKKWNTFITDAGVFSSINVTPLFEVRPEFRTGFNFNTAATEAKQGENENQFTDLFIEPGLSLRCSISNHNKLDTALFYKCVIEKSQNLNALGFRVGYFYCF